MTTKQRVGHTPSPWTMTPIEGNDWTITGFVPSEQVDAIGAPVKCLLADVFSIEANAALIAAAPELLAALKHYAEVCGDGEGLIARQAIAKAEGRT